jgi:DNA-binding transcriptional MocR family regulator
MTDQALSPLNKPRRLAETLVDRFAQRMRDGILKRGEKLPTEVHIMEAEGVSRSVVREALSRPNVQHRQPWPSWPRRWKRCCKGRKNPAPPSMPIFSSI